MTSAAVGVLGGRCSSDPEEDSSARLSPLSAVPGANNSQLMRSCLLERLTNVLSFN